MFTATIVAVPIKSQYLFKLNYYDENRVNYVTLHVIMAAADEDVERAGYKVVRFLGYNCLKPDKRAISSIITDFHKVKMCLW